MEASFYLVDVLEPVGTNGKTETVKDVLFFKMSRPSTTREKNAVGTEFENKATRDHVAQYREAYKAFKKLNPGYQCAWPELEVEVSAPVPPVEEVAVPVLEELPAMAEEPVAE